MARKSVNGDTVMLLVSLITANHNLKLCPENISIVMDKMPTAMRNNKDVKELVSKIMNA